MPSIALPVPAAHQCRLRSYGMTSRIRSLLPKVLVVLLALAACSPADETTTPASTAPTSTTTQPTTTTTTTVPEPPILFAVGDIASCRSDGDEATAALLDESDAPIATLGDNVYERGTHDEFAECFEPSWGRHKDRIRPAPGNHDYGVRDAAGYYDYFGDAAGPRGEGWYSYDLGSWHVIALNSVCSVVGCEAGSAQEQWLRADLAAHAGADCTLAYWHHPRFSSGLHGSDESMHDLVQALYEHGADVVLAGHDHHYERFAPLDPSGAPDPEGGIRHFVAGTGGNRTYPIGPALEGSEARFTNGYGLLRLELRERSYSWEYIGVPGVEFTDTGTGTCR